MDLLFLLIGLVAGAALGALGAALVLRRRAVPAVDAAEIELRHERAAVELRAEAARIRSELERDIARLQATEAGLREQLSAAAAQQRQFAERVDAERAQREKQAQEESRIVALLTPVQESLRTMQGKVTDLETQRSRQHGELAEQLRAAAQSEERLRATAESLASALRNNSTRGVWGETQLRRVVEAAGLMNRVDFDLQSSISTESGSGRPDMIVRLPGGKSIAVDAKVPYNSYLEASEIPATATGEEEARRQTLLTAHAKQVKAHVDALAGKSYWTGLEASPEFTVAFIPSESLLAAALEQDPALLDYAFTKRIALASPVNLWAVLKTVALTWQQDVLTEDAKRLFDLSKTLYARLGTLAEHADKLGRSIATTVKNYNTFAASLESRVLVTARELDKVDEAKVIGAPSVVEEQPKPLTAPELTERIAHELDAVAPGRPELDLALAADPSDEDRRSA